ncbi:TPA: hypothetical protein RUX44_001966 [Aeromonas hydrophila]|uniref:hypothetical protein n=1 Tax=Aeromonas hydrophila TaxID=644 RepID=UPI00214DD38E|nr:hypothetical protein [Aeromonas hydrophila]MCR3901997.1 hypothetical protein [Aeromonas hydrophila]HDZ8913635.1 hypothetical protein [Aeromonas hydrophila]
MMKILSTILLLISMNVSANTAWFPLWQAYKPDNWKVTGTSHSCLTVTNISSGSVDVSVSYYNNDGQPATPPLTGSSNTPSRTLTPRQTAYWCIDVQQVSTGTNIWGSGTISVSPLDGQTEPNLVISQADIRSLSPSGSIIAWNSLPINGGLPF